MGFNPFKKKDWEKLGKKSKKSLDFTDDIRDLGRGIEDVAAQVSDIQKARQWAGHRINAIDKTLTKLPDIIQEETQEAANCVLKELLEAAVSKQMKVAMDIIDTVAPDSLEIALGPVKVSVGDVYDKVEAISRIAKNPPGTATAIAEAVKELAPESVSIDLSVGIGLLIQSDSLQVGVEIGWSAESVLEHLPGLLRKCGVPE